MQGKRFSWHRGLFIAIALVIHCGGAQQVGGDHKPEDAIQAEKASREPQKKAPSGDFNSNSQQAHVTPPRKVFLWRIEPVSSSNKTIYLLGSVHVGNPSFYPLDPVIEGAYQTCDALVVEVNTVAVPLERAMEIVFSHAELPAGQKIYNSLSSEVWNKLIQALEKYHVPVEAMLGLKPWFAAITLYSV